jgi:hypothetical protein
MKSSTSLEQRKGARVEALTGRIQPDRVVDPDEERLGRQRDRSALRATRAQRSCVVAYGLRGEQRRFERDDRLLFKIAEVPRCLGMPRRRIVGLLRQVLEDRRRR